MSSGLATAPLRRFSVLFHALGCRGVAPMVGGMMFTNEWNSFTATGVMVPLFCQTFPVLPGFVIVHAGSWARWRWA